MTGHKKFRDLVAPIMADPARRARIEARMRAMDDIIALTALSERHGAEPPAAAGASGVSQPAVSQLEIGMDGEKDVYLSTLRHYIEALGGRLEMTAVFPDETIRLVPAPVDSDKAAAARS
jgi:hypothetical protein